MRRRRSTRLRIMTILAALGGLTVSTVGSPAALGAESAPNATSPITRAIGNVTAVGLAAPAPVRLITGDLVVLPSASHPTTTVMRVPGSTSSFAIARTGSHVYVVPSALRTALDRLDLSLFDAGAQAARPGATEVSITYASASSPTAVPGVEVTSRTGSAGKGLVTAKSSMALAKVLQSRSAASVFAGISTITAATPTVRPTFPMHTVKLNVLGKDGRPGDGFVMLSNVDDMRRASSATDTWRGEGRVSIPSGNYQVAAFVFSDAGVSLPILPDVLVSGPRTITIDARTATTTPVVRTPQPTGEDDFTSVDVSRVDARGTGQAGIGVATFGAEPLSLTPVDAVKHGSISSSLTSIASQASRTPSYTYVLGYEYPGVVPRVMRVAPRAADLEQVAMRYHGSTATSGQRGMVETSIMLDTGGIGVGYARKVPTRMTVWAGGSANAFLQNSFTATFDWETGEGSEYLTSTGTQIAPGTSRSEEWNRRPSRPSFLTPTAAEPWCSACLQDGTLALVVPSFSDNDPGHYGLVDDPSRVNWSLKSGSKNIGSGDGPLVGTFDLPGGTAPVAINHRERMRRVGFSDATTSTVWTTPRTALGTSLTGWSCVDGVGPCRAVGLLEPRYDLPVSDRGTLKAGTASGRLYVTPYLSKSTVTSLAVDVRYGSGPWLSVGSTPTGPNAWKLRVPVSKGGGNATLRVRASDSVGSAVTQTVNGAWSVAP